MNWHSFIFSDHPADRIRRHAIFWLLWWIYFTVTYNYYLQVGLQKIIFGKPGPVLFAESFLLILIHMAACYFLIYRVLPGYIVSKRYYPLIAGIILTVFFLLATGYYLHSTVFPIIDPGYDSKISSNNTIWWTNINSGLLNAPKVIAAAVAIKLIKRWYLKQKEKERIEKEKLITDLQLMKAQMRPDFLFNSLDQIFEAAQKNSVQAPELLLKLADLLSYLLYECDEAKVPLQKELAMMKEYMFLEKARYGKKLELETVLKGDPNDIRIAPLLLLPFIENSFKHCNTTRDQAWINLEINIENKILTMKLLNGVADTASGQPTNEIKNIEKRLELLYPGKYELKRYIEQEIYVVLLKIDLHVKFDEKVHASEIINGLELNKDYAFN